MMPLPDMSGPVLYFSQPIQHHVKTQAIVNYRPVNTFSNSTIKATVQIITPEQLEFLNSAVFNNNEGVDKSKRYICVHTIVNVNINDEVTYRGIRWRIFFHEDWLDYNFQKFYGVEIK